MGDVIVIKVSNVVLEGTENESREYERRHS